MGTHSDLEPRQRLATAGLISCLLFSSTMGLLVDSQPAMQPGTAPQRTEYLGQTRESDSATLRLPSDDVMVSGSGAYLEVSTRTDYQATTAPGGQALTYTVHEGDSLWLIANAYDTDAPTLLSLNPAINPSVIQPGEELEVVPGFRGLRHTVRWGETLSHIASVYGLSVKEIQTYNGLPSSDLVQTGQVLLLPGARRQRQERTMVASRGGNRSGDAQASTGGWAWPITGGLHSSEYGSRWGGFHSGLDIAVPTGTPAAAAASGKVVFAGWDGGYGFAVVLDHGGGVQTRYAHASKLLVAEGQAVGRGENIILVGATGNSTGPHLHFEVLVNGTAQNPRQYLP